MLDYGGLIWYNTLMDKRDNEVVFSDHSEVMNVEQFGKAFEEAVERSSANRFKRKIRFGKEKKRMGRRKKIEKETAQDIWVDLTIDFVPASTCDRDATVIEVSDIERVFARYGVIFDIDELIAQEKKKRFKPFKKCPIKVTKNGKKFLRMGSNEDKKS